MSKHIDHQIASYLEGELEVGVLPYFLSHLSQCPECKQSYDAHLELLEAFKLESSIVPRKDLLEGFEKILVESTKVSRPNVTQSLRIILETLGSYSKYAAFIVLLLLAYILGNRNSTHRMEAIMSMKLKQSEMVEALAIEMINNNSASRRIQALSLTESLEQASDELINALIQRMLSDKHINVRLAALTALSPYADHEVVSKAMIQAIETETDPNILVELISILGKYKRKEVLPNFKALLDDESLPELLKKEIQTTINEII